MADNMLGWFQAGANIVAQGQQNRFQQQQLKAQESDRAIRERLLAQQIAQIDLANQQRQAELTRRAEEDAQLLQVNTAIAKEKAVFDDALEQTRAAGLLTGPVQAPDWQTKHRQAMFGLAQQGNTRAQEIVKSELEAESARALARQREASTKLSEARTTVLNQPASDRSAPPMVVKLQREIEAVEAEAAQAEQTGDAALAQAKRSVATIYRQAQTHLSGSRSKLTKSEFTKSMLPSVLATFRSSIQGQLDAPEETMQKALRFIENDLYPKLEATEESVSEPASPASDALPKVTTKAEFDALPPGSRYTGKDGRTYQKP